MKAEELYEFLSTKDLHTDLRILLKSRLQKFVDIAEKEDNDFESTEEICSILQDLFSGQGISFDVGRILDSKAVAEGETDTWNGSITVTIDPDSLSTGDWPLVEDPKGWVNSLITTIEHELIHREQLRRSKKHIPATQKSEFAYLSDKREIQAYAKDAVNWLRQYSDWQTSDQIKKALRHNFKSVWFSVEPLYRYYELFGQDKDDPKSQKIWKRFIKQLYQYADELGSEE